VKQTDYFDKLETMPVKDRQKYQQKNLQQAVRRAYSLSISARELMDGAGVIPDNINAVGDLEKIPIIRKNDLIEMEKRHPFGGFLTVPAEDISRVFISPGPIYEPLHTESIPWFAKAFWAAGFRKGDIIANTFSYHMSPGGVLFHEAIRDCGSTVIPVGTGNTEILIRALIDLKATGFVGTPSYLLSVIKKAEEMGHAWNNVFNITKAWFTGEILAPSIRHTLENSYRIDTYQAYAVAETGGALAYECREKHGLHLMDEYVIEIVDPATGRQLVQGETGEVVVTPVHNPTWGLLRFGTGDLSSLNIQACPCGRTAYKLTGIIGRVGDAVKVRGMFIVGKQAEGVFAGFTEIARAQIIVDRPSSRDEMTLKVELKDEGADKAQLCEALNNKFQASCLLRPDKIEFVPPAAFPDGGKTITDLRKWQ
jgi:phenylacetate-CoA ligase